MLDVPHLHPSRELRGAIARLFEQLLDEAGERAAEFSGRMKVGDVEHDPPDGECPVWCRWHGVCRVANP